MAITVNIYYSGEGTNARKFAAFSSGKPELQCLYNVLPVQVAQPFPLLNNFRKNKKCY